VADGRRTVTGAVGEDGDGRRPMDGNGRAGSWWTTSGAAPEEDVGRRSPGSSVGSGKRKRRKGPGGQM
jgi:hypothetical protein